MEKKMIESLTEKQELQLEVYADRWTKIGLDTTPIDRTQAERSVISLYESAKLPKPQAFIWVDSPKALVREAAKLELYQSLVKSGATPKNAEKEARSRFEKPILDKVDQDATRKVLSDCSFGQQEAGWLSFYAYAKEVLGLEEEVSELNPQLEAAPHLYWWMAYENVAIMCERPLAIRMLNERLHCDSGPAIQYKDGFSLWCLNGTEVPEWLVMTPSSNLSASKILALTNAEQRKEGIKKVGIQNFKKELKAEVIHEFRDYKLLTIEFENRRIGPYLEMVNDSTGQIHIEGVGEATGEVDTKIKTCQEALAWRGGFEVYSEPEWTA